ncbi:MAG: Hsp20/alpha crystallin family protein [Armatimonadota bacterium]
MSMVRWDPFADMAQLREQVNRLFEQSLTRNGREPVSTRTWAPLVDIEETADALVLHVELPGVTPEEIAIQIEGDTLTIRGERKFAQEAKDRQYVRIERAYGAFMRTFTLGVPVKQADVKASYREGVLEIVLPKAEEVKPKQIQIQVESAA